MSYERLRPTFTFDAERIEQLKAIAPEAFADGAINWEVLRAALGEYVEEDSADAEHFGLFWPGKREARRRASEPSRGTLIPIPGEGINEETTHNIFIEADNLDALKLLQKAYAGRVKMIYIDPPYNTGSDFVYRDDFRENEQDYLLRTGQLNEQGRYLTTNTKADGRYHSNWLNMMYPRLRLARTLLSDEGAIFASIDENEVQSLRALMEEIFGEENFITQITIQSNPRGRQSERFVATVHEYLLIFARDIDKCRLKGAALSIEQLKEFKYEDGDGRKYRLLGLRQRGSASRREDRPKMYFPIFVDPVTGRVSLDQDDSYSIPVLPKKSNGQDGRWMWSPKKVQDNIDIVETRLISTRNEYDVFIRDFVDSDEGEERTRKVKTIWSEPELNYQNGTQEVKRLMGADVFEHPKPVSLLRKIIDMSGGDNDIYMDFFSGSGTTAHATFEANIADLGTRQFLLIQIAEPTGENSGARKAGYSTISQVAIDRIRRASQKLEGENAGKLALDDGAMVDLGFKVFRFASSNYKAWQDYDGEDSTQVQTLFDQFEIPLIDGWQTDNLLIEVMLQLGFPLDSQIELISDFTDNALQRITSDFHSHSLYTCFDKTLSDSTIEALSLGTEDIFVCLDSALTDQTKARLSDVCNLRTI